MSIGSGAAVIAAADLAAASWLLDTGPDAFLITQEQRIVHANAAWTKLTGHRVEETVGKVITDFTHLDDRAAIDEIRGLLATIGEARSDHRIAAKDGRWLWVHVQARRGASGAFLIVLHDITAERTLNSDIRQLARSTALLR